MRLDKYLKISRIIKRRTIAKEACDQGRVFVNGKTAKAGTEVQVGDELQIHFGDKILKLKITQLQEHVKKDEAKEMFRLIE